MEIAGSGAVRRLTARACIVGGGPAGMMLAYLLGRAGVTTIVLEKHADFLRDFRGDTVHPSTMQVMHELGLLEAFLKRPHQRIARMTGAFNNERFRIADLDRLDLRTPFIAFMPQWDFLDFLAEKSARYPKLQILRATAVTDLIADGGRVAGVVAHDAAGELHVHADLVIGCDGRHSTVRARAGLAVEDIGAPIDVLWFRVAKASDDDGEAVFARFSAGRMMVTIDRGDYWQCAYVIPKNGFDAVRQAGLAAFRTAAAAMAPGLRRHIDDVASWDDVKLLTVTIDRLTRWSRPGLLCIGDAAHAMSPVGGVGINLAIQDAVATANLLTAPLLRGSPTAAELDAVRRRREFPVRVVQRMQVAVQNRIITPALGRTAPPPFALRLLNRFGFLRGLVARFVGVGVRPEHVLTGEAA